MLSCSAIVSMIIAPTIPPHPYPPSEALALSTGTPCNPNAIPSTARTNRQFRLLFLLHVAIAGPGPK